MARRKKGYTAPPGDGRVPFPQNMKKCAYCSALLPHEKSFGVLVAPKHSGPCGKPCLGGSISADIIEFHDDQCLVCNPRNKR